MKMKTLAAAAAVAAAAFAAHADETGPKIKVSGYGTIAAAAASDDTLGFHRAADISKGTTQRIDIGQDSRFGLQANVDFQSGLSAVGQLVAKRRLDGLTVGGDKDFDLDVEWLYGQYQIIPSVNVRLGRMALPTFLLSDSLNVGYAAPWLRAPVHVYSTNPMARLDGAQLNWRESFGGVNLSVQAGVGKTKAAFYKSGLVAPIDASRVANLNLTAEWGDWQARLGTSRATAPLSLFGPTLTIKDSYTGLGLQYDNGQALVMGEIVRRTQNDQALFGNQALANGTYGYVAGGWRFGNLLPLLMVSRQQQDTGLPGGGPRLKGGNNAVGASLRYDVASNVALKAQVDRYAAKDDIAFLAPRDTDHGKVNIYTVGLDFVF